MAQVLWQCNFDSPHQGRQQATLQHTGTHKALERRTCCNSNLSAELQCGTLLCQQEDIPEKHVATEHSKQACSVETQLALSCT